MVTRAKITFAAIIFASAFAIRSLIFYGIPVPTGDAGQYATFVAEISLNSGSIPALNSLYFPGTQYIYPPLLFYASYLIQSVIGIFDHSILLPFYILLYLTITISSLQAVFLFFYLGKFQTHEERIFSAIILIFSDISIYALSWGGYPFLLDLFILILILYFLDKRENGNSWIIYASLFFVIDAYSHDLTYFYSLLVVAVIILFDLLRKRYNTALKVLVVLGVGIAAGASWWLPRLSFLLSAFSVTGSIAQGPVLELPTNTIILQAVPFMLPIIFMALIELYATAKLRKIEPIDTFMLAFFCTISGFFFVKSDVTIVGRMLLYSYEMLMIVVLKNLRIIRKSEIYRKSILTAKKNLLLIIAVFLLVLGPVQFYFGSATVSYYSTGEFTYSSSLIEYGQSHFNNTTVIAPDIGTYLSAADHARVILYSGYLVGSVELEQRNAALSIILDSGSPAAFTNISKYNVSYIVVPTNILNTSFDGHSITFSPSFYTYIGEFDTYSLFEVSKNIP